MRYFWPNKRPVQTLHAPIARFSRVSRQFARKQPFKVAFPPGRLKLILSTIDVIDGGVEWRKCQNRFESDFQHFCLWWGRLNGSEVSSSLDEIFPYFQRLFPPQGQMGVRAGLAICSSCIATRWIEATGGKNKKVPDLKMPPLAPQVHLDAGFLRTCDVGWCLLTQHHLICHSCALPSLCQVPLASFIIHYRGVVWHDLGCCAVTIEMRYRFGQRRLLTSLIDKTLSNSLRCRERPGVATWPVWVNSAFYVNITCWISQLTWELELLFCLTQKAKLRDSFHIVWIVQHCS